MLEKKPAAANGSYSIIFSGTCRNRDLDHWNRDLDHWNRDLDHWNRDLDHWNRDLDHWNRDRDPWMGGFFSWFTS